MHPDGRSAPAGDFSLDLTPGWHQLANPFFGPINFADTTVVYQGAAMDLLSADGAGIMAAFAWTYDAGAKNYTLAYPPLAASPVLIPAWQGLWVKVYKACTLVIARPAAGGVSAPATAVAAKRLNASPLQVDWSLRLRASSAAGTDAECVAGVASPPLSIPKPPPADGGPVLTMGGANASAAGQYAVALAQSGTSAIIWKMQVSNLHAGQSVRVMTPDLSALPHDLSVVLEDPASGQTVYLRTSGGYSFTPRARETTRELRLTASRGGVTALQVQSLSGLASRSGGAQVAFTLSAAAACTVRVTNMAGREVRVVEEEKLRPAGNNIVLWDGRSHLGVKAPPGLYLLQVTAQTTSGQSVRAVSALRL